MCHPAACGRWRACGRGGSSQCAFEMSPASCWARGCPCPSPVAGSRWRSPTAGAFFPSRPLARGATLMHESVIGTRFASRVVGDDRVGDHAAVITEVEGSAHLTGYHQFVLGADDPIGAGFLLR